jgi:tetratricopeptide (TPR) repeat protein
MGKNRVVYRVKVTKMEGENQFQVTWSDVGKKQEARFNVDTPAIAAGPLYKKTLWKSEQYALETGEQLYRFLDGNARHLENALKEARHSGQPLELYLWTGLEIADWPFELLSKEGSFLLTRHAHLIRRVSNWGETQKKPPKNQSMKLLFMACSAQGVKPELEFEKEEETIFRVTEGLAVDMEVEDSGSLEGLREQLERKEFDVVHLSGHADIDNEGRPYFIMEDEAGYRHDVFPEDLWDDALSVSPPYLLFLSGCRTGEVPETLDGAVLPFARQLVEQYSIPAVLGWGRAVNDKEATFAEQIIYKKLSIGNSIHEAVKWARFELNKKFTSNLNPAWPLLRLFSGGAEPGAIVEAGQKSKPTSRVMKHIFLKESDVQVLKEGFVGRRRQLQKSIRVLKHNRDKYGLLLLGTSGLGKSCLAGKICERFSNHNLIIVQGKLDSVTLTKALKDSFIAAQDEEGIELLNTQNKMTEILANLCATSFKEKEYLILLDDFEQNLEGEYPGKPGLMLPKAADLLKTLLHYLPFSGKMTQLLITCRYNFKLTEHNRDLVSEKLEPIFLTSFGKAEQSKKAQALKHIIIYPDKSLSRQLLEAGYGNPRLMEWLNALVGEMSNAEVPQLLEAVKNKQKDFIEKYIIEELLERSGEALALFLNWFSIFRRLVRKFGAQVVGEKAGLKDWENLLKEGIRLSLIEHDASRDSYRVTPLLQAKLAKKREDSHACHEAALNYYKVLDENKSDEGLDAILEEEKVYHAIGCGDEKTASHLGGRLIKHLRKRIALQESKRVGLWIITKKEQTECGLSTYDDAFLLRELATTVYLLGEHRKAIDYLEQALSIYYELLGSVHPDVAICLNNLGGAWHELGKHEKAIQYYTEALRIDEVFYGKENSKVADRLNNLGEACMALGEREKAIGFYEKALRIDETVFGTVHHKTAIRLNNLGGAWDKLKEHRKAIDYYEQVLRIDEEVWGKQHPELATDQINLGSAWASLGEPLKAINYYEEAIEILENNYGKHHPHVAAALNNLGEALFSIKEPLKAISYFDKALEIDEALYGRNHPNAANRLNNLGAAYFTIGKIDKAKSCFEEAYPVFLKFFGPGHPNTLTAVEWLKKVTNERQKHF